ncbi:general substrate transporter [Aspergillus granulosus]|uniref:General substrate transporter n=1 Tax=Aspergillus granulosus TaxID=176169 RepID=A0ABR4GSW9_9EURO
MMANAKTEKNPADAINQETLTDGVTQAQKVTAEAAARGQGTTGYETLTVWQTVKKFKMNALVCFAVTFSAATDGYQIGIIGNIVANKGFIAKFGTDRTPEGEVVLASSVLSTWAALGSLGQIIGMTSLPFLSDRFGRKPAMFTYWFILALSIMTECLAEDWRSWLAAKMVGGIGVGCLQSTIPTYISEVSPVRIRGAFLMCYSLWFTMGQFFAPVALQVLNTNNPDNYLTAIYTQWSQIGLMLLIYIFIPESPAWCASKGRETQAKKMLGILYKGVDEFDVDYQYKLMVMNVEHERAVAAEQRNEKWYSIFKGTDGMRTLVSLWTLMAQCFIGLGVFFSNASYFFQQAGLADPFKVTCITSGINIFFSFIVIYLADTTGRRWLACTGTTVCWLANVAVGILGVSPHVKATDYLLVLFSCIWNVGLVANGATGWGFIGEISSQRLRPYTAGFAAASTCAVGIVMGVLIPYMLNTNQWNWGLKTCWFFAGVGLPFTVGMWFLIPETAGRSAAELDELFERKIRPYRFHKATTMTQQLVEARAETDV